MDKTLSCFHPTSRTSRRGLGSRFFLGLRKKTLAFACMHAATQQRTAAQSESMLGVCFFAASIFISCLSKPPPRLGRGYKPLAMGMGFMVQARKDDNNALL